MSSLVSIIIPAYNAEKWIRETIISAKSQTWAKKEIIIVDDGSTDNTLSIIQSLEAKYIKIIKQNNAGPCAARNSALSYAQGDYIQYLDADDILAPDKIAQQMNRAEGGAESKVLLSSSMGFFYYRFRKSVFRSNSLWQDLMPVEWLILNYSRNIYIGIHAWLTSRKLTEIAGPWNINLWKTDGDGEYFCRVVSVSSEVRFVPQAKCYYRKGINGSLSATRAYPELEMLVHILFIKHILSCEDSIRTRYACKMLLQNWVNADFLKIPGVFDIASELAMILNVKLKQPVVNRKFAFVKAIFGYNIALAFKNIYGNTRGYLVRKIDWLLYSFFEKK
jgi:glycosyltransferase involved in cell wall biosynthesis